MPEIKVADEVWVAMALLHREQPHRESFPVAEIEERLNREGIAGRLRPGVRVHLYQHCVANRRPNPGRYRMLTAVGTERRLWRPGDACHADREGAKCHPEPEALPERYRQLVDWYLQEYCGGPLEPPEDPILALRDRGAHLSEGEDPDAYVTRLREGWR